MARRRGKEDDMINNNNNSYNDKSGKNGRKQAQLVIIKRLNCQNIYLWH